ncbi:MAG: hypothetical protein Q8Q08_02685 [Candidatus Omnitrophota bacterium]|nr:hypothetical protein [Candidatus Omnitrophota bacterium]MDZ4243405.1 hypothetical protein [Candidatus Omnitrophota bacterium]
MRDIWKSLKISALTLWAAALLGVAGAVVYSPSFNAPFLFDDNGYILTNPAIQRAAEIPTLWERLDYRKRFIGFLSFAVNYRVHGDSVFGYHAVNVAIHVASAWAVWWLVALLLAHPQCRGLAANPCRKLLPFSAAFLFLTHPVQTQAVTYISQRFTSLSALFYLTALCLYMSGRRVVPDDGHRRSRSLVFFTGALVFGLLAIFTKETALTLPVTMLLYEFCFSWGRKEGSSQEIASGRGSKALWIRTGIVVLAFLFLLMGAYIIDVPRLLIRSRANIPVEAYLFTQFQGFFTYLRLLVLPIGQNLKYDYPLSYGFWKPLTVLGFLGIAALGGIALKIRRPQPLVSFSILWFFVHLALESSVIPIRDVISEHRLYLPSVGFYVLLVLGTAALARTRRIFLLALGVVILIYSGLTYQRNVVWGTGISLWADVVGKSPRDATGHINIAAEYFKKGELSSALMHLGKAVRIYETRREERFGRVEALFGEKRSAAALDDLEEYVFLGQQEETLCRIHGGLNLRMGRDRQAREDFDRAVVLRLHNEAFGLYAAALKALRKGDVRGAREYLLKSREILPISGEGLLQYLENSVSAGKLLDERD